MISRREQLSGAYERASAGWRRLGLPSLASGVTSVPHGCRGQTAPPGDALRPAIGAGRGCPSPPGLALAPRWAARSRKVRAGAATSSPSERDEVYAERRGEAGGHAPGPPAGELGAGRGGWDRGAQGPGGGTHKPRGKSGLSPSLPAMGVALHPPRLSGGSSAFLGCESQPTPNRRPPRPPPPSAGGRTHRRSFLPPKHPRSRAQRLPGPRPRPGDHPPGGGGPAACCFAYANEAGGGEEGKATRGVPPPRRSPRAGTQIPLPPVTELVPLCRLSRNQSRHGCDT